MASVEPSSTIATARGATLWANTERTASAMVAAALNAGITTE